MIFGCEVGPTASPSFQSSSCSFSPAREPTNSIGICSSVRPESSIICRARSRIFTGLPMSSTYTWPRPPIAPAWTTSDAASGIVMKKRVISGCVTVTGPPRSIWRRKIGITEPDEPSTLPKRTATNRVVDVVAQRERLDDPLAHRLRLAEQVLRLRRLVGRDQHEALDAELDRDLRRSSRVASTLFVTAWSGFVSSIGTCLYAAAWKTTSGR